jgi:hypothetical protein
VESLIESAEQLVVELREAHPRGVIGAIAIHQREESAACIENLIEFLRGYVTGTSQEQQRLTTAASALLSEIAKLRDALHTRQRFGLNKSAQQIFTDEYLNSIAPRLWTSADRLRELLEH